MPSLIDALSRIGYFIDADFSVDKLDELVQRDRSKVIELPVVQQALNGFEVLQCLDSLRDELSKFVNEPSDMSWEHLIEVIAPNCLLGYLGCLIELGPSSPSDRQSRRLALLAGETVFLLASIPGAKAFNAFHGPLVESSLALINMIPKMLNTKSVEYNEFMLGLILLVASVAKFLQVDSLVGQDDLKVALVKVLSLVMTYYYSNYQSSHWIQLFDLCFDCLNNMCNPIHGQVLSSLFIVMSGTMNMSANSVHSNQSRTKYTNIRDWFLSMLDTSPNETAQSLTHYMKVVLTNPPVSAGTGTTNNIDTCVLYDREVYRKCSFSIVPFLQELEYSSNIIQRANCLDFVIKALLLGSASVGECREIEMVRMLIVKISDPNERVRVKAIMGFQRVATEGNEQSRKIFKELFESRSEDNITDTVQEPTPESVEIPSGVSTEGMSQLFELRDNLLASVQRNLTNHSAHVRVASIQLLQWLMVQTTLNVTPFLKTSEFRSLNVDTSVRVRGQIISTMERIYVTRTDNPVVIGAFVRLILDLASDNDEKTQELVMACFIRNIFDQIRDAGVDSSESPWRLLNAMLNSTDTKDLRVCIAQWMHKLELTQEILRNIESHTRSTHSSEAWILMSLVAPKITSRNPEMVVSELKRNLSTHVSQNDISYVQLEIVSCWLKSMSSECRHDIRKTLRDLLMSGDIVPSHVQRVFELSRRIESDDTVDWTNNLVERCKQYVRMNANNLGLERSYDMRLIHYIYVYGEALPNIKGSVNQDILNELRTFIRSMINRRSKLAVEREMAVKVICVIIFLSKAALFDFTLCQTTIPLIGKLLKKVNHNEVSKTAISCLCDIFHLDATIANFELPSILAKTQHGSPDIRLVALQSILKLIYNEYIKLRGDSLMYILATLNDPNPECAKLTHDFLTRYTIQKDRHFMQLCLKEAPFVLNGYMHLDYLKMFRLDRTLDSPVQGENHRLTRQYVYKFCVYNIDPENCYGYFKNLKLLLNLFKTETLTMSRREGLDATLDFFYVISHICEVKAKPKAVVTTNVVGEPSAGGAPIVGPDAEESGPLKNSAQISRLALICVLETTPVIADLHPILVQISPSMKEPIHQLCVVISNHFTALMDSAVPHKYWNRYRNRAVLRRNAYPDDDDDDH